MGNKNAREQVHALNHTLLFFTAYSTFTIPLRPTILTYMQNGTEMIILTSVKQVDFRSSELSLTSQSSLLVPQLYNCKVYSQTLILLLSILSFLMMSIL
jgi:hypothetical protein